MMEEKRKEKCGGREAGYIYSVSLNILELIFSVTRCSSLSVLNDIDL